MCDYLSDMCDTIVGKICLLHAFILIKSIQGYGVTNFALIYTQDLSVKIVYPTRCSMYTLASVS